MVLANRSLEFNEWDEEALSFVPPSTLRWTNISGWVHYICLNSSFSFGNEWKLNYVVLSTDPYSPILSTDSQNYLQYIPWSYQDSKCMFSFFLAISSVISLMFSSLGSTANWARPRRQSVCGEDAQKPEVLEQNLLELVVIQINAMTNTDVKTSVHDL